MLNPELETLDQLLGGDLSLAIVRQLFTSDENFLAGVHGLLAGGDVRLVTDDGSDVPNWRWRELFNDGAALTELSKLTLALTEQGATRIK